MRKLIRNRRGDISAPVITILLVIASISIAALVISWLFGVGIATSKQASLVVVGTPTMQLQSTSAVLYITLKNAGNVDATINGITISLSTTTVPGTISTTTIPAGQTVSLTVTFTNANIPSNVNQVSGVILSTAGTIPFIAVIQR
jgi:hypothetical protein